VAFHPGKPLLAVCSPLADGSIRLWEPESRREVQRLDGHTGPVRCCLWRADGRVLISAGGKDGTVRLWDVTDKTPRSKVIALGKTESLGIALSPEGRYLATANADGTLYVLRLAKAAEVVGVP
jgi:WD40 repeat protein